MNFFKSQDEARRNTRRLVVLFLLAIVSLIILTNLLAIVIFNHLNVNVASPEILKSRFDWNLIIMVSAGVTSIILFGSLYKVLSLSSGGARVAEMLDAELIIEDSGDANKQKILNVVEEMAIASGTPVPPVIFWMKTASMPLPPVTRPVMRSSASPGVPSKNSHVINCRAWLLTNSVIFLTAICGSIFVSSASCTASPLSAPLVTTCCVRVAAQVIDDQETITAAALSF